MASIKTLFSTLYLPNIERLLSHRAGCVSVIQKRKYICLYTQGQAYLNEIREVIFVSLITFLAVEKYFSFLEGRWRLRRTVFQERWPVSVALFWEKSCQLLCLRPSVGIYVCVCLEDKDKDKVKDNDKAEERCGVHASRITHRTARESEATERVREKTAALTSRNTLH